MSTLARQRILVTGGAGFIGSNLVARLCDIGADVVVCDIDVHPQSLFRVNELDQVAKYEQVDIREQGAVDQLIRSVEPDHIVHLGAQTLVTTAYEDPRETLETNINGTVNILESVRLSGRYIPVVVASSDKAYGKTDDPYTEDSPLHGDHPYDVSKSATDLICQTYYRTYRVPVVVARFGNVYGEGDWHFDRIVPGAIRAGLRGEPLEIRSDGTYVRDYLYVGDVASGYVTLLEQSAGILGEAFNFSSPDKLTVIEVVARVSEGLGCDVRTSIANTAKNEIPYQHLIDAKARALGWSNQHTMRDVMPKVIDWYRQIVEDAV